MPLIPPLQCLFCNHLNPADASFCNSCGSQMHLQPCDRCGAVDKRSAKACYKCDSAFTLPAASEPEPAPVAPDQPLAEPALFDADTAQEFAPAHPDPAHPDPAHALLEAQPVTEMVTTEKAATATGSRRPWPSVAFAILFVATALTAYYYARPPARVPPQQGAIPVVAGAAAVSVAPIAAQAKPTLPAPVAAASAPAAAPPKLVASSPGLDAVAAAPSTVLPRSNTDVMRRAEPAILKDCPQAVAALGLCSPGAKQEK